MDIKNINSSFSPTSNSSRISVNNWLEKVIISAKDSLQKFANQSSLTTDLELALGEKIESDRLKKSWQTGEVIFPEIEVVDRTEINYANGAFAQDTNKIYLSQEFLLANINNLDAVTDVVLEEYGHFVDSQLNVDDAPGDEGAIFAALVRGEELSKEKLRQLKSEDDTAVVRLDGKEIEIEQNAVSSNGQNIAYLQNNNRLFIQNLVSGNIINTGFEVSGLGINETDLDLSADGKYIVFNSFNDYTNLGVGDINGYQGVPTYVYEIETGNIENINVISYPGLSEIAPGLEDFFEDSEQLFKDNFGGEASSAEDVSISADGRYVVYSEVNSFDPDYTDSIVLVDRINQEHILIPDGSDPTISGDGRYVAYEKSPGIYLYDQNDRSSTKIADVGNEPKISSNGNYIIYQDLGNLYFYDRLDRQITQIYSNPNNRSNNYSITDDGRVAYYDSKWMFSC